MNKKNSASLVSRILAVVSAGSIGGCYIGDPAYAPSQEEMNRRSAEAERNVLGLVIGGAHGRAVQEGNFGAAAATDIIARQRAAEAGRSSIEQRVYVDGSSQNGFKREIEIQPNARAVPDKLVVDRGVRNGESFLATDYLGDVNRNGTVDIGDFVVSRGNVANTSDRILMVAYLEGPQFLGKKYTHRLTGWQEDGKSESSESSGIITGGSGDSYFFILETREKPSREFVVIDKQNIIDSLTFNGKKYTGLSGASPGSNGGAILRFNEGNVEINRDELRDAQKQFMSAGCWVGWNFSLPPVSYTSEWFVDGRRVANPLNFRVEYKE